MKQWGMTLRLFIILLLTGLCITIPFLWNYARETDRYLTEQDEREELFLLTSANQTVEAYADHIKNAMILIASNVLLQAEEAPSALQSLLSELSTNNAFGIHTLYYAPQSGKLLCSRQAAFDAVGNPALEELLGQANEKAAFLWVQPYYSTMSGWVLACAIPVRDNLRRINGILVAECTYQHLLQQLDRQLVNEERSYGLLDDSGKAIHFELTPAWMPRSSRGYPPEASEELIESIVSQQASRAEVVLGQEPLRIHKTRDNQLGWQLALIRHQTALNGLSGQTRAFILQTGAAILLGLCLLSLALAWVLMKPLRRLVLHMRSIRSIHDLRPIGSNRTDEIGQLVHSYDFMMRNIQQLMRDIRTEEGLRSALELKMLRSQIGPHFLYNTLSCIGSLSRQGKTAEASSAISALIELLSFSFDRTEELVPLADELRSLEAYVSIQHMRYGEDMFRYQLVWDRESLVMRLVPKLILQPLVENAIFHGLLPSGRPDKRIEVRCVRREDALVLEVRDNGVGIPPDKVERLLSGVEEPLHDRFSSIGLANVAKRLRLRYGDLSGLEVVSAQGEGTCITLRIPWQESTE